MTEPKVGIYTADYSPLTDDELAREDQDCVELFKHSSRSEYEIVLTEKMIMVLSGQTKFAPKT